MRAFRRTRGHSIDAVFLTGTLLNAATVLVGGLAGTFLGARLPEPLRRNVVRGLGLFTLVLGVQMAIRTENVIVLLLATLVGGLLGAAGSLDDRLNALGDALDRRLARGRGRVSEAFVTASLVFCVGPLTFLGAIQNGLTGDITLLSIKSVLDGFAALAFAASLGWGVLLSVGTILLYQGSLAAGATFFQGLLSDAMIREMSATGGLLIVGVGLRLLEVKDLKIADFLPAIVVAPLIVALVATVRV
jgi:uncharacterized membrane protein YqgA involved in biofilm formation